METFTQRLNRMVAEKKANDVSVLAIARRAEIGGTTLRKLLSGDSLKPDIQTAERLAKALGVSRDELLHGRKPKGPESLEEMLEVTNAFIEAEVDRRLRLKLAEYHIDPDAGPSDDWFAYQEERMKRVNAKGLAHAAQPPDGRKSRRLVQ